MGQPEKKKALSQRPHVLPDWLIEKGLPDTLDRWAYRKDHTAEFAEFLLLRTPEDPEKVRQLFQCGNYLKFGIWDIPEIPKPKLLYSNLCKNHHLCSNCAARRGNMAAAVLAEKCDQLLKLNPSKKLVFITFTVKNGEDLNERLTHLRNSHKKLKTKRRNAQKGKTSSSIKDLEGGAGAYELTYNSKTKEWHPHIHEVALVQASVKTNLLQVDISKEWHKITGDSFVVDVKEVQGESKEDLAMACLEIMKYSLKQANMTPMDQYKAYLVVQKKRLHYSYGCFYGFKFPEDYNRDAITELMKTNPYLEVILKYNYGRYVHESTTRKDHWISVNPFESEGESDSDEDSTSFDKRADLLVEKIKDRHRHTNT